MILFYSGYGCSISDPETYFGDKANVMLTYVDFYKKKEVPRRYKNIRKARKKRLQPK